MFGGFYLKNNDKTSSFSKLDQTNDNFTLTSSEHNSTLLSENNQRRENVTIEEVIGETIEVTETINYNKNTII